MVIEEVFPNPTVKQVVLQIRYPNLFYLEDKIGDFQIKIMKEFPKSALLYRRQILLADIAPQVKEKDLPHKIDEEQGRKIWQFECPGKYRLNVLTDSLDITSQTHKTYNNPIGEHRFRDIIKLVLDNFIKVVKIPIINRVGLRYIDECPIKSKDNKTFKEYYNTTFPLKRFNIKDAIEMNFAANVKVGEYFMNYAEALKRKDDKYSLILDFDGYTTDILPEDYLSVTDRLHNIISEEYERTIKKPVKEYMRKKEGD